MAHTERRKSRRIADAVDLQIQDYGASGNDSSLTPHFVRLSATGLRVIDSVPLDSSDRVSLTLRLSSKTQPIQLNGRVIECGEESSSDRNRYYASIGFVGVSDENRRVINEHVERVYRSTRT